MGKITNSSQVSLEFKPWTDNKYRITRLQVMEQLGGEIARGEIDMFLDGSKEARELVTNQTTGTISITDEKEDGLSYEIEVFITDRDFFSNVLNLKFVCIKDPNFYIKRVTTQYGGGIKSTIQSLYPGKSDIRIEPSVPDIVLNQCCETNYEFCKRLCYSYKEKSVFAFGWDGLLLKDMCGEFDHTGEKEPNPKLTLQTLRLAQQNSTFSFKYDKLVNSKTFLPWEAPPESTTQTDYTDVESKNCQVSMNYKQYRVMGRDLILYLNNAWNNSSLMDTSGYTSMRITQSDMPHYKLGDVVTYEQADEEDMLPIQKKTYLVTSNELFYSTDANQVVDANGLRFSWTSHLYGLEEGEWSKDPDSNNSE